MRSSLRSPSVPPRSPARRALARRALTLVAVLATALSVEVVATAPAGAVSGGTPPYGHLSTIAQTTTGFRVTGWAYDPSTSAPAKVKIRVDNKTIAIVTANTSRPDVGASHRGLGNNRGFTYAGPIAAGVHQVCVWAVNYPSDQSVQLDCYRLTVVYDPSAAVSYLTQVPGALRITGWALDPSNPAAAITAVLSVDGRTVQQVTANRGFANFAKAHPGAGDLHGYTWTTPIAEGTHTVCVVAVNIGLGKNSAKVCRAATVNFSPTGSIASVVQNPGGFTVTGYASDPDTTSTTFVAITADGKQFGTVVANDRTGAKPGYGFHAHYLFPSATMPPGAHTICVVAHNLGQYGKNANIGCLTQAFNWNPTAAVDTLVQKSPGASVSGWASDPDTTAPIHVLVYGDGKQLADVVANATGSAHSGHRFQATVPLTGGRHTVCVAGVNVAYGSGNSPMACRTVTLNVQPYGGYDSATRSKDATSVVATGWAIDPDTTAPITVQVSVDGAKPVTAEADVVRTDIAKKYPGTGTAHGYVVSVPATAGEHRVCVSAVNVLSGSGTTSLGCRIVNAVHPVVPAAPTKVTATAGYGGARIAWTAPTSDGGAPWSGYTVKAAPGGTSVTVAAGTTGATVLGLRPSTTYSFSVVANNVAGASAAGVSPAVTTQKEPPAQTSPAPVSTSRYIRNIRGSSASDLAVMRAEGVADAKANPSGHGYLVLLDIGGQDESRAGVILSAGIRFVSYTDLVKCLQAYVDGYASAQRASAPITVALGTNNDIDVSTSSGANWANKVVDPVVSYAARYPGVTIAGANDIEPGFNASYAATANWLHGYLAATRAPFVFNGSADGCAWTVANRNCNNGWTMRGLYNLAGGVSPIRILNLPQVYNSTMAAQWRYISLTGVQAGQPRINFGGALTEYTACQQAGSCGSLSGRTAWTYMWNQLQAEPKLRPSSLPYSTDLRIDS